MKIGFIGIGNMGGAIIEGWLQKKALKPTSLFISNRTASKRNDFAEKTGVHACESIKEVAVHSDVVFLAAKPADFASILEELSPSLSHKPVLVSLAAGISLTDLTKQLDEGADYPFIRIMPNLNHRIGEGMAAICATHSTSKETLAYVLDLFDKIGETVVLPEEQFSIFSAIAGCSPAFTFTYIDALARAAVRHGLNKETAVKIAAQAVMGTAKLTLESSTSPMDLADQVASPGGTTIEGVLTLAEENFVSSVIHAVDASFEKDQQLLSKYSQK